jgi:molybdenum cofactor cytidylyltransferase
MQFQRVATEDAEGGIVAHAVRLPGLTLKKGEIVDARAVTELRCARVTEIVVARLEPGDTDENAAAQRLAEKIAGVHVRVGAAFTGRGNFFSKRAGVCVVNAARVDRLNDVDESITLATLAPWRVVAKGDMVATVKIIPFAVEAEIFARAMAVLDAPLLFVAPFVLRKVGMISTILPGLKRATIDKTVRTVEARLLPAGAWIAAKAETAHEVDALARALRDVAVDSDIIVVFGASAITDRRDVIPAAIELAGGSVDHLGMPVDPGNLLLLGEFSGRPVIGAPGCARSMKENGFDFVLYRLLAGLPVSGADIRRMGVGGLLMEIPSRPQPRAGFEPGSAAKAPSRRTRADERNAPSRPPESVSVRHA